MQKLTFCHHQIKSRIILKARDCFQVSDIPKLGGYVLESYAEFIERSFNILYLCPNFLYIRDKVCGQVSRFSKAEQSKISGNITVTIEIYESTEQPTNWVSKAATFKGAFIIKNQLLLWLQLARKHDTGS